jgi:phenylacetate-CoA ligase
VPRPSSPRSEPAAAKKACTTPGLNRAGASARQREGAAGLARRQEARLASLIEHARAGSPFYQRLYRDQPAHGVVLRNLPPVTKPELMAAFDDWVTDPAVTRAGVEAFISDPALIGTPWRGEYFVCTSSGTTVYRAFSVRADLAWLSVGRMLGLARRRLRGRPSWAGWRTPRHVRGF